MRKPKFKVGDKVRVLRASTEEEHDLWMDSWQSQMNYAIGKVMTIEHVDSNNYTDGNLYPKYRFIGIGFNFPEFVLENKIRVGEQLVFSFMSEAI